VCSLKRQAKNIARLPKEALQRLSSLIPLMEPKKRQFAAEVGRIISQEAVGRRWTGPALGTKVVAFVSAHTAPKSS
jgi:hypothetical protein